jgi:D-amino-acid dehydrogenase
MMRQNHRIIVVGAGVIGLACAVELQNRGREVYLIDPADPGLGCSSGNAGIVATSEIFPIISPFRLLGLPRMLVDRDGPAAIRFAALPGLTPWVARAVATLSAKRQHEIIRGLAALNEQAVPAWRDLLKLCGAPNLMAERGMLGLTRSSRAEPVLQATQAKLIDWGIPSRLLTSTEVRELEPVLTSPSPAAYCMSVTLRF